MTPEEKKLLLKDLVSRLPYGVKAEARGWDDEKEEEVLVPVTVYSINTDGYVYFCDNAYDITYCRIEACHPFLRPMSSMTEEEMEYIKHRWCYNDWDIDGPSSLWREKIDVEDAEGIVDYFNEHHFDFRGIIPMGLALEAPDGIYKTE